GVFPRLAIGGRASVAGGQVGPFAVRSASATTRIVGNRVSVDAADADLGFVRFSAAGIVGLTPADPLSLRVHATVPDLAAAVRRVLPHRTVDVGGSLESDALITGSYAKPKLTAGFDMNQPRYGPLLVQRIIGNVESDLHSVKLNSAEFVLNHGSAVIAGSLPLSLNPAGIGPADAPLSITADAHNVDLAALASLLPGSGTKLAGTVNGHLALEGTVGSPRILGTVDLTGGSYVSNVETSPIRAAAGRLVFEGTSVALQALHARVGAGSIDAQGRLDLPIAGLPDQGYAVTIAAKGAQVKVPAFGGGTIDGTARLVSGAPLPTLSGNVTLTNATIPFAAIFRPTGAPAGAASGGAVFDLALDLHAESPNIRIKSPIIDVGAAGHIALTGTMRSPRAAGQFSATRGGVFSTYQRLFRIQDATVTFDPSQGIVPNLNLHATAHVENPDPDPARNAIGSADITVSVTGPADGYTISYASQPAYSQAQIVALLVDLPVLGSLNFGHGSLPGTLRGAPGESDALLPPGVTPYQTGVTPLQQEAFSLLNTQLTQRLLSPLENAFGGALGLTDLQLTLDYGGRVGYTARQQLSRKHAVYATVGQVLSYPTRTQIGFASQPDPATTISFTYFQQNGTPYYSNSIFGNTSTVAIVNGIQPLSDRQGFSFTISRTYP
ncbi:MAG TPA: translocation/assembly module TamB domain-containing protein, partial [Candidatus Lustribacter sp.]